MEKKLENKRYRKMRERRHQTARELKDVNCNVIATFQMSAIIWQMLCSEISDFICICC